MTKRISRALALFGVAGTMLIGGAGIAQASHGADDPPGHHRHHHHAERHHHHHHHGRHHR
ncbi:MAG: hypothetical protein ACJ75I_08890 [Solirubrobacterales bacterium]